MFLLGNLVIGQVMVASLILVLMGADTVSSGAAGTPELVATIGADMALLATILVWMRARHPGWVGAIGVPPRGSRAREIGVGVLAGPIVYGAVAFLVATALAALLAAISGKSVEAPDQIANGLSVGGKLIVVVVAVGVAPITEELFFRGVLFRAIRDRRGFATGAIVSAVLFGLVHYVPAPWQDTVLLQGTMVFTGLALAGIYEWRGNLLANIVAHMTFNLIGVVLIFTIT